MAAAKTHFKHSVVSGALQNCSCCWAKTAIAAIMQSCPLFPPRPGSWSGPFAACVHGRRRGRWTKGPGKEHPRPQKTSLSPVIADPNSTRRNTDDTSAGGILISACIGTRGGRGVGGPTAGEERGNCSGSEYWRTLDTTNNWDLGAFKTKFTMTISTPLLWNYVKHLVNSDGLWQGQEAFKDLYLKYFCCRICDDIHIHSQKKTANEPNLRGKVSISITKISLIAAICTLLRITRSHILGTNSYL